MDFDKDIEALSASPDIEQVLRELCELTQMGFAAVARVTEARWIACQVDDRIGFGLEPGGELEVRTTICDEIRASGEAVFIDQVSRSPHWHKHPTPLLYGFQSYVSVPLHRKDGSFFGTLCAIDPEPHVVDTVDVRAAVDALALRVMAFLDTEKAVSPPDDTASSVLSRQDR